MNTTTYSRQLSELDQRITRVGFEMDAMIDNDVPDGVWKDAAERYNTMLVERRELLERIAAS